MRHDRGRQLEQRRERRVSVLQLEQLPVEREHEHRGAVWL
jgi:hypothetical protein